MNSGNRKKDEESAQHVTHIASIQGQVHSGSGDINVRQILPADMNHDRERFLKQNPLIKSVIKILFLAANPKNTDRLRLDEEIRAIDQRLRMAEFRDRFDIIQHWSVQVSDIQGLLLRHRARSCALQRAWKRRYKIILEDSQGKAKAVPAEALVNFSPCLKITSAVWS